LRVRKTIVQSGISNIHALNRKLCNISQVQQKTRQQNVCGVPLCKKT